MSINRDSLEYEIPTLPLDLSTVRNPEIKVSG